MDERGKAYMKENPLLAPIISEDMRMIYDRSIPWEDLRGKSVLITGAYGMLASYVVFFLAWLNEEKEFCIHILAQGRSEVKIHRRFGMLCEKDYFTYVGFDLMEPVRIEHKIDYIIHAAGAANPREYAVHPVEVAEANSVGTWNLLKLAVEHEVKSFLFFSSGDVYGKYEGECGITEETFGMLDPLSDHACYGESKRMGETFCRGFWLEYQVPTIIARIGHTYGPTMDTKNDPRTFASFIRCAIERRDIVMMSDGSAKRPFCYIVDATAAFFLLLLKGERGEAYNVCNTKEFLTIKEFAGIVADAALDGKVRVVYRERAVNDDYLEDKTNRMNKPLEDKLMALGGEWRFSTQEGVARVIAHLSREGYKYVEESL